MRYNEIAIECIAEKAKTLKEFSMRYERDPATWPDLKDKHKRYQAMLAAIEYFEAKEKNETGLY